MCCIARDAVAPVELVPEPRDAATPVGHLCRRAFGKGEGFAAIGVGGADRYVPEVAGFAVRWRGVAPNPFRGRSM